MDLAAYCSVRFLPAARRITKLMIVASGERSQFPQRRAKFVNCARDLIRMEIFVKGTVISPAVCRTPWVGQPTAEQEKIWGNLMSANIS